MEIFVFFTSGSTKLVYFLRCFWIFRKNHRKNSENKMIFRFPLLKNLVFSLFFYFTKNPKNFRKYNSFVLPNVRNPNISIVVFKGKCKKQ